MKPPYLRYLAVAFVLCAAPFAGSFSAAAQLGFETAPEHADGEYGFGSGEEAPSDPLRILGTASVGTSLRFIQDLSYGQERFAPAYVDLWGGVALPGGSFRHALGLHAGFNISGDGNASVGVDPATQWQFGPSYALYMALGEDWMLLPKFTIPIAISPQGPALGFELALGAAYKILAGLGIYAELGVSVWIGGDTSIHPLVSGEAGFVIDYEVLP